MSAAYRTMVRSSASEIAMDVAAPVLDPSKPPKLNIYMLSGKKLKKLLRKGERVLAHQSIPKPVEPLSLPDTKETIMPATKPKVERAYLSLRDKMKLLEFIDKVCTSKTVDDAKFATYHPGWTDLRVSIEAAKLIPNVTLGHVTHMRNAEFGSTRTSNAAVDVLIARLAHLEAWAAGLDFGFQPLAVDLSAED